MPKETDPGGGSDAPSRQNRRHKTMMKALPLSFVVLAAPLLEADEYFTTKVEPILKERCFECHSHEAGKMKGGLTLDAKSGWVSGGDSGPAIVPGKPDESLLIQELLGITRRYAHRTNPALEKPPARIRRAENQGGHAQRAWISSAGWPEQRR